MARQMKIAAHRGNKGHLCSRPRERERTQWMMRKFHLAPFNSRNRNWVHSISLKRERAPPNGISARHAAESELSSYIYYDVLFYSDKNNEAHKEEARK